MASNLNLDNLMDNPGMDHETLESGSFREISCSSVHQIRDVYIFMVHAVCEACGHSSQEHHLARGAARKHI